MNQKLLFSTHTAATHRNNKNIKHLHHVHHKLSRVQNLSSSLHHQKRFFRTEMDYHNKADDTLESIQDLFDELLEDGLLVTSTTGDDDEEIAEFEASYSSGVLTIKLGHHGTWVLNKQTPNKQIWWSSPVSGPRRYEYDENSDLWIYTRATTATDNSNDGQSPSSEVDSLGQILSQEMKLLFDVDIDYEC